jgi:hypothetical protein
VVIREVGVQIESICSPKVWGITVNESFWRQCINALLHEKFGVQIGHRNVSPAGGDHLNPFDEFVPGKAGIDAPLAVLSEPTDHAGG